MANKITAINAYRPKIKKGKTKTLKDISKVIAGRTSMNEGAVYQAMSETRFIFELFLGSGNPVKLPGLGTFSPTISVDGKLNISFRVDNPLIRELNKGREGFDGEIVNRENIGKTSDELVTLWNVDNPTDPVA